MILVRATRLTAEGLSFAEELAHSSGMEVGFILDGRHPVEMKTHRPLVMLTKSACENIGLYCPDDFPWRCGDYGLYLARENFPDVHRFWMIEHDVRFSGGSPSVFFRFFEQKTDIDFLACNYNKADTDWWWYPYALGLGVVPYSCLFVAVIITSDALKYLLSGRRRQSGNAARRSLWPNDESFVATSLNRGGFSCQDFNDFGIEFHNISTMSVSTPIQGERLLQGGQLSPNESGVKIYHPVLFGDEFERGNKTSQDIAKAPAFRSKYKKLRSSASRMLYRARRW